MTLQETPTAVTTSVVWTEIPVSDLDAAARFYGAVLGTPLQETQMGGTRSFVLPYAPGQPSMNLQQGKPAGDPGTGPVVFFAVDDIEAAADRVWSAGGRLLSPVTEIAPGRIIYCGDRDENTFGLFVPRS